MMTYAKQLPDGRYEYGRIQVTADRRKDRLVPVGIADTYREVQTAMAALQQLEH